MKNDPECKMTKNAKLLIMQKISEYKKEKQ